MQKLPILVVDDEAATGMMLVEYLTVLKHEAQYASSPQEALKCVRNQDFRLVISDFNMPNMSGVELLQKVKKIKPDLSFIIMTGYGTVQTAVEAMRHGAEDFLLKPLDFNLLASLIERVDRRLELLSENNSLKKQLANLTSRDGIIGSAPSLQKVFHLIDKVANTNSSVLISGESGTGKELVAQSLHEKSKRLPELVGIDCVSLPEQLFESELFGYEKGAFTGADKMKKGLFECGFGGTLFLDEITELDYGLQAKLLRVLQERKYRRVGGRELLDMDMRIISATRRDPLSAVREGLFREDLYYRLNVIHIHLPPLRERLEDLPRLVQHFIAKTCDANGFDPVEVDAEVLSCFYEYSWPGNIRELKNMLERLTILSDKGRISIDLLPPHLSGKPNLSSTSSAIASDALAQQEFAPSKPWDTALEYPLSRSQLLEKFERDYFSHRIEESHGNFSAAARASGVSRKTLHQMAAKYDLKHGN